MKPEARASILDLWRMFGAPKAALILSGAAGLLAGGSSAGLVMLVNRSLSGGAEGADSATPLVFTGLCALALISSSVSVALLSRIAQENQYRLRMRLAQRILNTPAHRLESCGRHRLMAALTDDVQSVVAAQEVLPFLFVEGAKIVAAFSYLAYLSLPLLGFVLFFVVFGVLSYQFAQAQAMRWFALARETDDALFRHLRALTEGYKELMMDARRRTAYLEADLERTARLLRNRLNRANVIAVLANNWSETLYYVCIGAILFVAARLVETPQATLIGFTLAILFIGGPLSVIFNGIPAIAKGVVALRNIEALRLESSDNPLAPVDRPVEGASPQTLALAGVTYRHQGQGENGGYPIGPFDFVIRPGELIFLTGGNGSGKTTLALVILGLYAPTTGEVRIGGERVTDGNREAYRQNFSAVLSDSYLFDSLLGYGEGAQREQAEALLAMLELDHKLRIDGGRFSTIDLSRGERKRLALLAACLSDSPFFLFDEWAADQDPKFRDFFYRRLLPDLKARGKTVIVITHDDRYFRFCDRRLHLTVGQLEELQPHAPDLPAAAVLE
ncbi:cyclic peptide export ABC transporter [Methylocystis heyeri]|uniref:Cyclic peptide export ABC transporter n=1 Tax=Methylocystis heyeri TaxID=391905 RepID=A0A6B8KGD3_9HYPH|nr:cyclic peptide export ABC transporter [Methylocystis heyeri]QGM46679.1 cyclic peptide export ABC transporter [Methylocystis heyeri]